jgi:hypothetical protein
VCTTWLDLTKERAFFFFGQRVAALHPYGPLLAHTLTPQLSERKDRTKLGLSKFAAEAAEEAGEHPDKLAIAGKVKDVASVHSTLWPEERQESLIDRGILIGLQVPTENPDEIREFRRLEIEKKELPSPVIDIDANEKLPDAQEKVPEGNQ